MKPLEKGVFTATVLIWLWVLVVLLLGVCASSGFYNMSDAWCEAHPQASQVRCPR